MRLAFAMGFGLAALGCSSARVGASDTGAPALTFPAHFAEGNTGKGEDGGAPGARASSDVGAAPARRAQKVSRDVPDPEPPLKTAAQWEYRLEYVRGSVRVSGVRRVEFDRPVVTPRHIGRFAFELWIGAELVERVRFDFPLLAADLPPDGVRRPLHESPRFGPGAETSQTVMVPASDRATAATLVDRLTGSRLPLPWPPAADTVRSSGQPAAKSPAAP